MRNHADGSISVQTSAEVVPSTPSWFGEVVLLIEHLRQQGVLATISKRVRFVWRRFGHYEIIDFLAVLFGYAISGERTLESFYERLQPFAVAFMAQVSARSAALAISALTLFSDADCGTHRSPAYTLSR